MKKFAMTYATVNGLLSNADIRAISPAIQQAYESINSQTSDSGCSACAKKKKMNEASTSLMATLQAASDMELARIKKALGVDVLVFPNGMTFIER